MLKTGLSCFDVIAKPAYICVVVTGFIQQAIVREAKGVVRGQI